MRANIKEPWWLTEGLSIIGFEDDPEDEGDDETDDDDGDDDDDDNAELEPLADLTVRQLQELEDLDEEEREELSQLVPDPADKTTDGLKSALRKERAERKRLEKLLKKGGTKPPVKKKSKEGGKPDEDDPDEMSDATRAAEQQTTRLAEKLLTSAVDSAILRFADQFKDSSELLALVDRKEIEVDQDEDDPSEIDIDIESVQDAVRALAKKSPHLLKTTRSTTRSGSKFGGTKRKKGTVSDEELKKKYSALR